MTAPKLVWVSPDGAERILPPSDSAESMAALATLIGHDGHSITAVTYHLITCSCGVTLPTADFMTSDGLEPSG